MHDEVQYCFVLGIMYRIRCPDAAYILIRFARTAPVKTALERNQSIDKKKYNKNKKNKKIMRYSVLPYVPVRGIEYGQTSKGGGSCSL